MISIVMAYANRLPLLLNTLKTYEMYYADIASEFEVVLVYDVKKDTSDLGVIKGLKTSFRLKVIEVDRRNSGEVNPGPLYNIGVQSASDPDFIGLTNPENLHVGPVVKDFIERERYGAYKNNGVYRIYACLSIKPTEASLKEILRDPFRLAFTGEVPGGWYQHSVINNRMLNFMSFISTCKYYNAGGFDEDLNYGVAYDDDLFIDNVIHKLNLPIVLIDSPFVCHQYHDRSHWNEGLVYQNKETWKRKIETMGVVYQNSDVVQERSAKANIIKDF